MMMIIIMMVLGIRHSLLSSMDKVLVIFLFTVVIITFMLQLARVEKNIDVAESNDAFLRLEATATGKRVFIEEYRNDLQHEDYHPSEHVGNDLRDLMHEHYAKSSCSGEDNLSENSQNNKAKALHGGPIQCPASLPQGLVEFSDFGPLNNLPWSEVFAVSPGHKDVTGVSHFAFLDAFGARLTNGELEVTVFTNDSITPVGFKTKSGDIRRSLTMHYETSAYGYGRGDSQALAPPLTIRVLSEQDVMRELSNGDGCFCDIIVPDVVYAIGLFYYPQFGHTIFNGLSNMVATLWRKHIPYDSVMISPYLFRNTSTLVKGIPKQTYQLKWFDMFDELFRFHSSSIVPWTNFLDYSMTKNMKICFNRIMVGALPHLDHMNVSVPPETWSRFAKDIISRYYAEEINAFLIANSITDLSEAFAQFHPPSYPDYHSQMKINAVASVPCAVTIVTRDIHNARSIINRDELLDMAVSFGCRAQSLTLEKLSLKDQIGELRWNTTLLIAVDGTALLNALFMHECTTIMYVEMWRRSMMIPKFGPSTWRRYTPHVMDTLFVNQSDPIAIELNNTIQSYVQRDQVLQLENIKLNNLPFSAKEIENFLRNGQSTHVRVADFEQTLRASIRHTGKCRHKQF